MSTPRDWARFYVMKRGWALTPLHYMEGPLQCSCIEGSDCAADPLGKAGKHPVKGSWTDPSTMIRTEEGVASFWASRPWNVGLPTGQINKLLVIDIDPRNGGFNSLDEFEAIRPGGPLPPTLTAHTGGGGRHLFYALPAGVVIKKGPMHKDFPGIDIQSDGAQVVIPPSLHRSGMRYTWADGRNGGEDLTVLPADMIEFLVKRSQQTGGGGGKVDLDGIMKAGYVPEGQRNNALYAYACRQARVLRVDTASEGAQLDGKIRELTAAVVGWNMTFCRPPLDQDETLGRVIAATDWVRQTPGAQLTPEQTQWVQDRAPVTGDADPGTGVEDAPDGPGDDGGGGAADDAPPSNDPPDEDSLGDDGKPGNRTYTDNGNARRLIDYFGDDIRYSPGMNWLLWNNYKWDQDTEGLAILNLARELPIKIIGELPNTNPLKVTDLTNWSVETRRLSTMKRAVELARSDKRSLVPGTLWNADPWALGTKNGVVDLRNMTLSPPHREQYITRRAPLDFDPGARDPRWEVFLEQVTGGDQELEDWLQKVAGYTLTGNVNEEKFFMFYGPPASGKSTIGAVMCAMLGEYAVELATDNLAEGRSSSPVEYWVPQLAGRRLAFVSELPVGTPLKEEIVQKMSGDSTLQGRPTGGQWMTFLNTSKLWIATNHRPRVNNGAMWRRMTAIPFMFNNLAPDPSLKPYLLSASGGLPAALAWAIRGAARYAADGSLGTCAAVAEATAEYKRTEDRMGMFLAEDTRKVEGGSVSVTLLWTAHKRWELERGEGDKVKGGMSRIHFDKLLRDRGYVITGLGRVAEVQGLALMPRVASTGDGAASAAFHSMNGYS